MSAPEDEFAFHCRVLNVSPVREYAFAKPRRWRFDFAWPDAMLAVEIEGGLYSNGRHSRGKGYEADMEKYNAATLKGWRILRFSPAMVTNGTAINLVLEALK